MNDYFPKNKQGKTLRFSIYLLILLIICFVGSYFITDRLTNPKYTGDNILNEKDKMVYNVNSILDEGTVIVLMNDSKVFEEQSIKEFKIENDIDVGISQQFIVNYYKTEGYELSSLEDKKVVLTKDTQNVLLEPNKYYLGEKDGYFAIYRTDAKGKPFIEEDKDVYREYRLVNTIPTKDQEEVKSFKHSYDSKDEAKEIISGYIS